MKIISDEIDLQHTPVSERGKRSHPTQLSSRKHVAKIEVDTSFKTLSSEDGCSSISQHSVDLIESPASPGSEHVSSPGVDRSRFYKTTVEDSDGSVEIQAVDASPQMEHVKSSSKDVDDDDSSVISHAVDHTSKAKEREGLVEAEPPRRHRSKIPTDARHIETGEAYRKAKTFPSIKESRSKTSKSGQDYENKKKHRSERTTKIKCEKSGWLNGRWGKPRSEIPHKTKSRDHAVVREANSKLTRSPSRGRSRSPTKNASRGRSKSVTGKSRTHARSKSRTRVPKSNACSRSPTVNPNRNVSSKSPTKDTKSKAKQGRSGFFGGKFGNRNTNITTKSTRKLSTRHLENDKMNTPKSTHKVPARHLENDKTYRATIEHTKNTPEIEHVVLSKSNWFGKKVKEPTTKSSPNIKKNRTDQVQGHSNKRRSRSPTKTKTKLGRSVGRQESSKARHATAGHSKSHGLPERDMVGKARKLTQDEKQLKVSSRKLKTTESEVLGRERGPSENIRTKSRTKHNQIGRSSSGYRKRKNVGTEKNTSGPSSSKKSRSQQRNKIEEQQGELMESEGLISNNMPKEFYNEEKTKEDDHLETKTAASSIFYFRKPTKEKFQLGESSPTRSHKEKGSTSPKKITTPSREQMDSPPKDIDDEKKTTASSSQAYKLPILQVAKADLLALEQSQFWLDL